MCTAAYDFQNRDYLYGTNKLITLSHVCAKGNKFVLRSVQSTNRLLIGSFEYYKSQKVINKRYANIGTSMQSVRKSVILKGRTL